MAGTPILRYFGADHLPEPLRTISEPFGRLARQLDESLAPGPELSTALRKLLESKDAAVRAALPVEPDPDLIMLPANTPQPGPVPNNSSALDPHRR